MKTIAELVAKCHEQFDENRLSTLDDAARLFARMHQVWLGAEVATSEAESPLTLELLELREIGMRTSSDFMMQVDLGLSLLQEFCGFKALAMQSRLAGRIEVAVRREDKAEQAYKNLPAAWRW